jgi:transposase-like protein
MALVAWMSVMPRTRGPFPPAFRREAVELVLAGRSVRDVAESLGCSDQSLHNWVKQHQLDQREPDDGLTSAEREELRESANCEDWTTLKSSAVREPFGRYRLE